MSAAPDLIAIALLLLVLVASLLGGPIRTLLLMVVGWRLTRLLALPAVGVGLFAWFR
ncbi:hypothetical protein ACW9UR_23435 [Halovulum sp. GXIMD14794]